MEQLLVFKSFLDELSKDKPNYLLKNQIKYVSDPLNVLINPIMNSSFEDYNGLDEIPYWNESVEGQDCAKLNGNIMAPYGNLVLEISKSGSNNSLYETYQLVSLAPGTLSRIHFTFVPEK